MAICAGNLNGKIYLRNCIQKIFEEGKGTWPKELTWNEDFTCFMTPIYEDDISIPDNVRPDQPDQVDLIDEEKYNKVLKELQDRSRNNDLSLKAAQSLFKQKILEVAHANTPQLDFEAVIVLLNAKKILPCPRGPGRNQRNKVYMPDIACFVCKEENLPQIGSSPNVTDKDKDMMTLINSHLVVAHPNEESAKDAHAAFLKEAKNMGFSKSEATTKARLEYGKQSWTSTNAVWDDTYLCFVNRPQNSVSLTTGGSSCYVSGSILHGPKRQVPLAESASKIPEQVTLLKTGLSKLYVDSKKAPYTSEEAAKEAFLGVLRSIDEDTNRMNALALKHKVLPWTLANGDSDCAGHYLAKDYACFVCVTAPTPPTNKRKSLDSSMSTPSKKPKNFISQVRAQFEILKLLLPETEATSTILRIMEINVNSLDKLFNAKVQAFELALGQIRIFTDSLKNDVEDEDEALEAFSMTLSLYK